LALLLLAPIQRLDIAELEPVQTVAISVSGDQVVLETDTKNKGQGVTVQAAIEDLEKHTPGVIYLDTAQYLLITEEALRYAASVEPYLRQSVKVSLWDGQGSVEDAAKYLSVNSKLPTLRHWNQAKSMR
jgi:hypothetical protein